MEPSDANCFKWIILSVAIYIATFVMGMLFAFGSLLNSLLDKFNAALSTTVIVHSTLVGVTLSTGIFSGILISRFGLWKMSLVGAVLCPLGFILSFSAQSIQHLCICIGIISGFGISVMFISVSTVIGMVFTGSQKLLALAFQNTCIGISTAVLPYIFNFLVETYSINGTFLLIGGFYLNCIPAARLLATAERTCTFSTSSTSVRQKSSSPSKHQGLQKYKDSVNQELNKFKESMLNVLSLPYLLSNLAVGITMASLNGYISLIVDIFGWKGFSPSEALIAFPISYGLGVTARLLPGLIKQVKGVNSFILPILYGICGFAGQLVIYLSISRDALLIGCCITGMALSGMISAAGILVAQIVGQEGFAIGFGMIYSTIGILTMLSVPVYGAIRDLSQSYGMVLLLTAGLQLVGTFLFILISVVRNKETRCPQAAIV